MRVAKANIDKKSWDTKDQHRALLYTLLIGTNAHNIWDFIGSVSGKTCIINQHSVMYVWARCAVVCFDSAVSIDAAMETMPVLKDAKLHWSYLISTKCAKYGNLGHTSLNCSVSGKTFLGGPTCKILSEDNKSRLAFIYAKHSASISHPVSFGSILWANVVGKSLFSSLPVHNGSDSSGSFLEIKPTSVVSMELNDRFVALEHSLASFMEWMDIVMSESSDVATGGKTICGSLLHAMFRVSMSLLSRKIFDGMRIFTSGLDNGFLGAGVAIIMDNLLARHVSKVEEVPGHTILVQFLFKDKVSVSVVGLYTCASPGNHGSLILAAAGHRMESVTEFFDTDYRAVLVLVGLSGLLNVHLDGIHRNANKNCWKFKLKNMDTNGWRCFMECSSAKFLERSVVFHNIEHSGDLDGILWFSEFDSMKNKTSLKFHGLEMLMSKIVNSIKTDLSLETGHFVDTWMSLDNDRTSKVWIMINGGTKIEDIVHHISVVKKEYRRSKYHKSRVVKDKFIRAAFFRKVVFDHLIINDKLILKPQTVKFSIDTIMESWTRKHLVSSVLSGQWLDQYTLLDYINNDVFSGVMCDISLDELLVVKHSGSLALNGLLNIFNRCLKSGNGTLINTRPIALIETARKILSKILSNRISLACSRYNILHDNNFSVLKGTFTQFSIFAVGSIVENALEKNRELWLVLQDICKAYDSFDQDQDVFLLHKFFWWYTQWEIESVKKHKQLYDYRMCSKFYTKSGKTNLNSNSTSFFTTGVFVDNTIWIENCLMTTQNILNIASEFFFINDISINADKTVTIPINQGVWDAKLFISRSRISMAKRSESHCYLEIFLSTERLSKPSLAKIHANIRFFSNVVLRKTITEKQFLYLVSVVLQPIRLKLKANLPKDFPSVALHHPMLYGLKPFEQVLTESLMANLGNRLTGSQLNAPAPSPFSGHISGMPILDMLSVNGYLIVRNSLRRYGLIFTDQLLDCHGVFSNFVKFSGLSNDVVVAFYPASANVQLFTTRHGSIDVYINGFVKSLGSIGACGGATAYFPKANTSVGIKVFELLFSTLVELQAIALALECVPESSTVTLFTDSQTSLDICKFNMSNCGPDFRHKCWIEKKHICYRKVKGHSSVIKNEQVDFFANAVALSKSVLPLSMLYHFFSVKNRSVSGNAHHFVRKLFDAVNFVSWESKFGTGIVDVNFVDDIDSFKFFSVWHSDGGICSDYTSLLFASLQSYLIKFLYCCLPVAVRKKLYDLKYPSMVCIRCRMVEDSDYLFLCKYNNIARLDILSNISMEWCKMAGNSTLSSEIMRSLSEAKSSGGLYMLLAKRFVLKSWVSDTVLCLGLISGSSLIVKLVHNIAKSHRLNIWLPAAKLRAFYKKCNLLPQDGSAVLSVGGLLSL
ncbi:hypothetical protein G9A89_008008 [Geosiphon pyriformis]|nr:hypothetical protein G9A89_008008 [Geosiphon pyriformis]